ncbi:hypothetical protein G4D61_17480 [Bacillus ginsengihumi]|uniref:Peptidase M50 n=1 Tax=Heyndrickxia ginsengihumi TaxID=363870 RepID=A0A6M0PD44_9BACI|nr:hypothetical protein [Heyndrickxia ginsengihumi]NEY21708.1 hypothetical protein [Heyndrickxia ginsengihumi]
MIKHITVNNKNIEIVEDNINSKYYIYNYFNNRTIIGNKEVVDHLVENSHLSIESPLYNFVEHKKKINILDFSLLKFKMPYSYIAKVGQYTKLTNMNVLVLISLILSALFIFLNLDFYKFDFKEIKANIIYYVIVCYLTQLFILMLHEISHYYYYYEFFQPKYSVFGITFRYFSLFLFFTSVPFIDLMDKKNKEKLILAGIKTQIFIMGIFSIYGLLFGYNTYFQLIYCLNFLSIAFNLLPFFKLDGYWYASSILRSNNYMIYFFDMLKRRKQFNFVVFIMGIINILMIFLLIIYSFLSLCNLFIK